MKTCHEAAARSAGSEVSVDRTTATAGSGPEVSSTITGAAAVVTTAGSGPEFRSTLTRAAAVVATVLLHP